MNLINNKKAQSTGSVKVDKFTSFIIGIAVIFFIASAIVPTAQTAGDDLGDASACSRAGGFFNTSQELCLNGTTLADVLLVPFDALPLASIFGGAGVVFILVAVFLLKAATKGPGK